MTDEQQQLIQNLQSMVETQRTIIECHEAEIRSREMARAWTTAARTDPAMRQRLTDLAEDETAEVGLPNGWRFDGLRAVRGDATSEPVPAEPETPATPPEVRTSMHEQLDSLTQRYGA